MIDSVTVTSYYVTDGKVVSKDHTTFFEDVKKFSHLPHAAQSDEVRELYEEWEKCRSTFTDAPAGTVSG